MISKTTFHFLVHYLHRPEYDIPTGQDDNVRQTIMLAEEFLNLLLIILGNVIFIYMYVKRKKNQLFFGIIFIRGAQFSWIMKIWLGGKFAGTCFVSFQCKTIH